MDYKPKKAEKTKQECRFVKFVTQTVNLSFDHSAQ